jgi:DNA polymerase III subunit gamma/tau
MTQNQKYQVIARRFRPQTFAEVVGQEAVVTTLKNALRFERLAHAYLFCGSRGTGKTTLARLFAKALNCHSLTPEGEPCNSCPPCLEITSGYSLDVLEIDGASNRGIDDIRQINETVGYAPAMGKYKIYLIDEVHMLTKEAFNALLKTLEEPPSQVKFFFATTEPHKVLPTIISRCQRFDLHRIAASSIQEKLMSISQHLQVSVEEGALALIAAVADGSLRDAESLFDQILCYSENVTVETVTTTLGLVSRSLFEELDRAIQEGHYSFAFECTEKIYNSGKDIAYFLEELMQHFHNHLISRLSSTDKAPAFFYTQEQCLYFLDFLMQTSQEFAKSSFKRIHLEMILLHLIRNLHRLPLDAIASQLLSLKGEMKHGAADKESLPLHHVETSSTPIPDSLNAAPKESPDAALIFPLTMKETSCETEDEKDKSHAPALEEKIAPRPEEAPPAQEPQLMPPGENPLQKKAEEPQKYETLMRFAAVELEGTIIN